MGIEIIGKLTQKNNGDFKLVDLADVDYDGTGKSAKQELENKIEEAKNSQTPYDDTEIKTDINNIKTDLGTEELTTTSKKIKGAINDLSSQINKKANKTELAVERSRIDNFVTLPEGSTTGDAELIDARVGADGVIYPNLGDSIRTQFNSVDIVLNSITVDSSNLYDPKENEIGKYLNSTGNKYNNDAYFLSGFIPVSLGDTIWFTSNFKYVNGFDSNKQHVKQLSINQPKVTISDETIVYIRFTGYVEVLGTQYMVNKGDLLMEYQEPNARILLNESEVVKNKNDIESLNNSVSELSNNINANSAKISNVLSLCGSNGLQVSAKSLAIDTLLELENFPKNLKKGISISLNCKFDTFSGIYFGKGYKQYRGDWLEIDGTNVIWKHSDLEGDNNIVEKGSVAHNLTIEKYLAISIYIDDDSVCHFSMNTLSGTFTHSFEWGYEMNGYPFVLGKQSLNNVQINAIPNDTKRPMWLFGDSYFGVSKNRVMGQLKNLGFTDNVLIDGLAGYASSQGYDELIKCLQFGKPKYILWCLGMNDSNTVYNNTLTRLKKKCEELNITLILMIIPTVPSRDKEGIKETVINSGYRYINAYDAVGTNLNGEWYAGYLSNDNLHPTEQGAKAIAMRIVTDVPEIMQYGYSPSSINSDITGDL